MKKSDPVSTLIRESGGRAALHAERRTRMFEIVQRDWRAAVDRRRRARRWMAVTAAVLLAIVMTPVMRNALYTPAPVGTVLRVTGSAWLLGSEGRRSVPLESRQSLAAGDEIVTENAVRALVRVGHLATVRIDEKSGLQMVSATAVRLARGAVYLEVPSAPQGRQSAAPLEILTPFGTVQHVGTRFEVRIVNDTLRVRVRDGRASYKNAAGVERSVSGGDELLVRSGIVHIRHGLSAMDEVWDWTGQIRPAFSIEGRSLEETLAWLAHEGGFEIEYASPSVQALAADTVLHGSIDSFDSRQAFDVVLTGSGLQWRLDGERALISPGSP